MISKIYFPEIIKFLKDYTGYQHCVQYVHNFYRNN